MGTNCSRTFPLPCPDGRCNQCNVSVNERPAEPMDAFCTLAGEGGDSYREAYCQRMSSAGEWRMGDRGDATGNTNCDYNDCNNYQEYSFGCCRACCGITGKPLYCQRVSFTGDPTTCCLADYTCNGGSNPNTCFSDGENQQHTCSDGANGQPNYRDITSSDCQDVLLQYCSGTLPTDDPNSTEWLDRWTVNGGQEGSCAYALRRNLFAQPNNPCSVPPVGVTGVCNVPIVEPINSNGYFWGQTLVNAAMTHYAEQGFVIGALPGFVGYNPFQNFLYDNVCCPYPGLCQEGLASACSAYNSQRLSLNPSVSQWCGCHLPAPEYESYSTNYNIPPQCTPICNRIGTIPIVGINAAPVACEQNICLMDGVTVNLVNSQIGGGIDFNQVCGDCPAGQCSCVVTDSTIDVGASTIGGNFVPINAGCGGSAVCTQPNPGSTGPATITVPCGATATNPYTEYEAQLAAAKATAAKSSLVTTLIVVGIVLLAIFFIVWLIHPSVHTVSPVAVPLAAPIPGPAPLATPIPVATPSINSILSPPPPPKLNSILNPEPTSDPIPVSNAWQSIE